MPWSSQGGGGWKSGGSGGSGGGGPWGQWGGGPGSGQQPDLEEILKRSQDRLKQFKQNAGVPGPLLLLLGAIAAAVVGFYAFAFIVRPDELGVVLRFGQFVRQEPEGLHFRLPYPIEEVRLPKVTRANTIAVGYSPTGVVRGTATTGVPVPAESIMLTADENVIDVQFVVYWRIQDAEKFLFQIQNPESTVKDVAESAMREVVGRRRFDEVLTTDLGRISSDVQKLMQDILDSYNSGVVIQEISLQKVLPPAQVGEAFRDVQNAKTDLETLKNEAQAYANRVVPEARGEADRVLAQAQGYKQQVVAEATGQASRFNKIYTEYRKAPEVTRQRMFLETMERVYGGTDKIILDSRSGSGVVPYLPLNELQPQRKPDGVK